MLYLLQIELFLFFNTADQFYNVHISLKKKFPQKNIVFYIQKYNDSAFEKNSKHNQNCKLVLF